MVFVTGIDADRAWDAISKFLLKFNYLFFGVCVVCLFCLGDFFAIYLVPVEGICIL